VISPLETKTEGLTSEGHVSRDEKTQITLCYISVKSLEKLNCKCQNFSVTVQNSCWSLHRKVHLPCCKQHVLGFFGRSVEL